MMNRITAISKHLSVNKRATTLKRNIRIDELIINKMQCNYCGWTRSKEQLSYNWIRKISDKKDYLLMYRVICYPCIQRIHRISLLNYRYMNFDNRHDDKLEIHLATPNLTPTIYRSI